MQIGYFTASENFFLQAMLKFQHKLSGGTKKETDMEPTKNDRKRW